MRYIIIWQFIVQQGKERAFEEAYGSNGLWVRLFQMSNEYIRTTFVKDTADAARYMTIDEWNSPESFRKFKQEFITEYEALDRQCESLTEDEIFIGEFSSDQ